MQDDDPYVRKTAAVCVAKLYDINPELVEDRGFLDLLKVCVTFSDVLSAQSLSAVGSFRTPGRGALAGLLICLRFHMWSLLLKSTSEFQDESLERTPVLLTFHLHNYSAK